MFATALDEHPIVEAAKGKHTATVILLHGLGDTGAGWADLAPELQSSSKTILYLVLTRQVVCAIREA